jgi:hypothetical protein
MDSSRPKDYFVDSVTRIAHLLQKKNWKGALNNSLMPAQALKTQETMSS